MSIQEPKRRKISYSNVTYFEEVIISMKELYSHLLMDEENKALTQWKEVADEKKSIYIRLYGRKPIFFSSFEIWDKYAKDSIAWEQFRFVQEMLSMGWIREFTIGVDSMKDLLNVQTMVVLKQVLKLLPVSHGKSGLDKHGLIELILAPSKQMSLHSFFKQKERKGKKKSREEMIKEALEKVCKCSFVCLEEERKQLFQLLHRLYYLSPIQDQSLRVMKQMKIVQYPTYRVSPSSIFDTREQLQNYEESLEIHSRVEQFSSLKVGELQTIAEEVISCSHSIAEKVKKYKLNQFDKEIPHFKLRYTPGHVYTKTLFLLIQQLEKIKSYSLAFEYIKLLLSTPFCPEKRGKWWIRGVIDLCHSGLKKEAYNFALEGMKDETIHSPARLTLEKKAKNLAKSLSITEPIQMRILNDLTDTKKIFIKAKRYPNQSKTSKTIYINEHFEKVCISQSGEDNLYEKEEIFCTSTEELSFKEYLTVEEVALQFYNLEYGLKGFHSEGSCFRILFALIFWDIIYDDTIPDVWQTEFQCQPLDYRTGTFFLTRKNAINKRLEEIAEETILDRIYETFEIAKDLKSVVPSAAFKKYGVDILADIFQCVGGKVCSAIMQVFVQDPRNWTGFPDLILYDPIEKKSIFCEVKGPSDRLSDKQHFWLQILKQGNVEVAHVEYKE